MKTFEYSYKEKDEIINKKIKANSIQDAKNFLKRKNITPISIKVEGGGFFKNLSVAISIECANVCPKFRFNLLFLSLMSFLKKLIFVLRVSKII